jgi:pyruvate kinase
MPNKKTKIVCTLGPASDSVKEITALVDGGMNVARLNFSHGTFEHHKQLIDNIHKIEQKNGTTIGILQDLQGPKIRLGQLPKEGIKVCKGDIFKLTARNICGKKNKTGITIPVDYTGLIKDAKKGDTLLIDDGLIEAKVIKKEKSSLQCQIVVPGTLKSRKGIHLPTGSISKPAITAKDKKDLKFGLENNVDFIALSFVKSKKDIQQLRKLIAKYNKGCKEPCQPKIIAKIERHEAIKNLNSIVKEADGIMVARGDLGIDIPPEQVPIIQKRMIALANKYGKPVITATQVLQSMVTNARPTRAEISDAANAVFDHTDAIMLSNESAVGKYPAKAANFLARVAAAVEKEMFKHPELQEQYVETRCKNSLDANCLNASELAQDSKAKAVIAYTTDGYTAQQLAKQRSSTPIITLTPSKKVARQLSLVWGLNQIFNYKLSNRKVSKTDEILGFLKKEKLVRKGDKIVIICNASKKENLIATITV